MKKTKKEKNKYSQTSRLEKPEKRQLHHFNKNSLFLTVISTLDLTLI
jgi:hypothetical protein